MAKQPTTPSEPAARPRRGRPPKPGGRIPQVEVQRAYRARLAAAGKVVRIVDAAAQHTPLFVKQRRRAGATADLQILPKTARIHQGAAGSRCRESRRASDLEDSPGPASRNTTFAHGAVRAAPAHRTAGEDLWQGRLGTQGWPRRYDPGSDGDGRGVDHDEAAALNAPGVERQDTRLSAGTVRHMCAGVLRGVAELTQGWRAAPVANQI